MANKEPASQAAADDLTVSANRTKAAASAVTKGKRYRASIYPETPIPAPFAKQILELEAMLEIPIWLIVQNGARPWGEIGHELFKGFQRAHPEMADGEPAALLIESPGGDAHFAYRIARMLQNRTGDQLTVIVPQYRAAEAKRVARQLVEKYPTHGFVIDSLEASSFEVEPDGETFGLGLNLCDLGDKEEEVENRLERLTPYLDELTVIGRVQERT